MKIEYTGRHFVIDDRIREFTSGKLSKLEKYLYEPVEIRAILEVQKYLHRVELNVVHRYGSLQATEEAEEMRDAINSAVDKIDKQARRAHKKNKGKKRRSGGEEEILLAAAPEP